MKKRVFTVAIMLLFLCACSNKEAKEEVEGAGTQVENEVSSSSSEDVEPRIIEDTEMSGEIEFSSLDFSSIEGDTFITDSYCYYEGDRFVLFAEPGVKMDTDIVDCIEKSMNAIEKYTGEKYLNDGEKSSFFYAGAFKDCFGDGRKNVINLDRKKVEIYCLKEALAYAYEGVVIMPQVELSRETADDFGYGFTHELVHQIEYKNIGYSDFTTMEGLATYVGALVVDELYSDVCNYDSDWQMSVELNREISSETAEDIYTHFDGNWGPCYSYGYYFFKYVSENVDPEFPHNFIEAERDNKEEYWTDEYRAKSAELLKNMLGESVFADYGAYVESTVLSKSN